MIALIPMSDMHDEAVACSRHERRSTPTKARMIEGRWIQSPNVLTPKALRTIAQGCPRGFVPGLSWVFDRLNIHATLYGLRTHDAGTVDRIAARMTGPRNPFRVDVVYRRRFPEGSRAKRGNLGLRCAIPSGWDIGGAGRPVQNQRLGNRSTDLRNQCRHSAIAHRGTLRGISK